MRSIINRLSALFQPIPGNAANFFRKNKKFAALTILCVCSLCIFATAFFSTGFVTIVDGGNTFVVRTIGGDAASLLSENGIVVGEHDEIVKTDSGLSKTIEVIRAFPVTVSVDGITATEMVTGGKVSDVLKKMNVTVNPSDFVSHGENLPVYSDLSVVINRVNSEIVTVEKPLDFTVVSTPSADLLKGKTKEVKKGEQGLEISTLQNTYVDGILTNTVLVSTQTAKQPVNGEVLVGTAAPVAKAAAPAMSRGGTTSTDRGAMRYSRKITMKATAYTYGENGPWGEVTATGKPVKVGYVAVDPRVIPLGTRLYVEGYGYCVAEDTGGSIKGNRIDLFFNSRGQCYNFGVRNVDVYVVD